MAVPAAVSLVIKPLLKAIAKEAAKIIGTKVATTAATTGATTAATTATAKVATTAAKTGLSALAKGSLTSTDVVNIMRAAIDKKIAPSVAKSLGMTTKELKAITDGIRMTDARRAAVTGKNYIKNINRFVQNPQKSIKGYVKNELRKGINKQVNKTVEKASEKLQDAKESVQKAAVRNALLLLDGKLKSLHPSLGLSDKVWQNVDNIDIEDVYVALTYVEMDLYDGTTGQTQKGEVIVTDREHKGYKGAMQQEEFVAMMEDMLIQGHHTTPIDGII